MRHSVSAYNVTLLHNIILLLQTTIFTQFWTNITTLQQLSKLSERIHMFMSSIWYVTNCCCLNIQTCYLPRPYPRVCLAKLLTTASTASASIVRFFIDGILAPAIELVPGIVAGERDVFSFELVSEGVDLRLLLASRSTVRGCFRETDL